MNTISIQYLKNFHRIWKKKKVNAESRNPLSTKCNGISRWQLVKQFSSNRMKHFLALKRILLLITVKCLWSKRSRRAESLQAWPACATWLAKKKKKKKGRLVRRPAVTEVRQPPKQKGPQGAFQEQRALQEWPVPCPISLPPGQPRSAPNRPAGRPQRATAWWKRDLSPSPHPPRFCHCPRTPNPASHVAPAHSRRRAPAP